jgi:amino acid permease
MLRPFLQPLLDFPLERSYIIVGVAVLVLPLCLLRDIDKLGFTSVIGIVAMFFSCASVIYYGATNPDVNASGALVAKNFNFAPCAFQVVPIIDFALMCHLTIIPAVKGLQPYWPSKRRLGATRFRSLVFICCLVMSICVSLYIPTGVMGYILAGNTTAPNILNDFGGDVEGGHSIPNTPVITMARACVAVCVFFSFPIPSFVGLTSMKDILGMEQKGAPPLSTCRHTAITTSYLASITATALLVVAANLDLDFVLSLVGCTAAVVAQYMFPAAMLHSRGRRVASYVLFAVGLFMSVCGVFVTISSALCKTPSHSLDAFCSKMGF